MAIWMRKTPAMHLRQITPFRWKFGQLYFQLYCLLLVTTIVHCDVLHELSECPLPCLCVKSIGLVNCSGKNLKEIPNGIPAWTTQLVLRNNRLSTHGISTFDFSRFQQLEELDLSDNKLVNFTADFSRLPILRKISLEHCLLSTLPNITIMSNVTELLLSHNSITDIVDKLKSFSSLIVLDLSFNKLRQIKPDTFSNLTQLRELYLQKNRFSSLSWSTFSGLIELEELDISRNKIKSIVSIESTKASSKQEICFGNLQTLKTLNLSQNQLTRVDGLTFAGMCSLETVLLDNNRINRLSDGSFYGPTALRTLILDHNDIGSIKKGWLFKLEALQTLSIAYNNITMVESEGWKFCRELIHLNLSHNRLVSLPSHGFSQLSKLQSLRISDNTIAFLEDFAFDGLGQLASLDLSNNMISSSIEDIDGAFLGLDSIQYLSLRGNRIRSFSASALEGGESVMTLDLRYNDVTSIQNHTFDKMTDLKTLNIISSSFLCDCQLAWFPSWLESVERTRENFKYSVDGSCFHPPALKGRDILNISQEEFVCVAHPIPILLQEPISRTALIGDNVTLECSASATYTDMINETMTPTPKEEEQDSENPLLVGETAVGDTGNPLKDVGIGSPDKTVIDPPLKTPEDSSKSGESRSRSGDFPLKADEPQKEPEKKRSPPQRRNAEKFDLDKNGMTVTWKRGQEIIQPGSGIEIRNITRQQGGYVYVTSLLVLKGVTSEDNGKYNCIISNNYGYARSKPVELVVNEYPRFTKTPANVTVVLNGSSALLDCAATGQPSPQIQWQKDGGKVFPAATERRLRREQTNPRKLLPTDVSDSTRNKGRGGTFLKPGHRVSDSEDRNEKFAVDTDAPLDFAVVLPVDSGEYECVVESIVGRIVTKAVLIVEMPPYFPKLLPVETESSIGGSAVIQCISEAKPDPKIRWSFNELLLNLTNRHYLAANGQMLIITGAEKDDAGVYKCFVENKHGSISHAIQLRLAGGNANLFTALVKGEVPMWIVGTVALAAIAISILVTAVLCHLCHKRKRGEKASSTTTGETDLEAPADGNSLTSSTDESVQKARSSQFIHLADYATNTVRATKTMNRHDGSLYGGSASLSDITHMQILQSPGTQSTTPTYPTGFGGKPLAKRSHSSTAIRKNQIPISRFCSAENFKSEETHPMYRMTQSTISRGGSSLSSTQPIASPSSRFAKKAAGDVNYVPVILKTQQIRGSLTETPFSGQHLSTKAPSNGRTSSTIARSIEQTSTSKGRTSSQKSKHLNKGKGRPHKKEQNNTMVKNPVQNGKLSNSHNMDKMGVAGTRPHCEQNGKRNRTRQYDQKDNFARTQVHEPLDRRKNISSLVSSNRVLEPFEGYVVSSPELQHVRPKPEICSSSCGPLDFSSDSTLASESSALLHHSIPMVHNYLSPPSGCECVPLLT